MTTSKVAQAYAEVIGDPISQSKSPLIHNFWLQHCNIDAVYRHQRVKAQDVEAYFASRRTEPQWRGCNVTMPHKQAVMPLLDQLDPVARRVGAVNTVARASDGGLIGYNTDVSGFLEPLRSDLDTPHLFRMARVLGTGGAARAIVAGLTDNGFVIVLVGRDQAKAQQILDELAPRGEHYVADLTHFASSCDFQFDDRDGILDLVINASPLGMRGQPALSFDWSHAPPGSIAYDIVTDPICTPFLTDAEAAGHRTIDGLSMLIGQAAAAFNIFFDDQPPRNLDHELRELLAE